MSAPFYEVNFPWRIAAGAEAVVRNKTSVQTMSGGGERRTKRWSSGSLRTWDALRGIKETADLEEVRAMHINMDGKWAGFRFKDFSDYRAERQVLDTSAGGSLFQLRKGYVTQGIAETLTRWRTITKPTPGGCILWLNGLRLDLTWTDLPLVSIPIWAEGVFGEPLGGEASIDYRTGVVIVMTPASLTGSDLLEATFEFDCKARFGSDEFKVKAVPRGKAWQMDEILIKETR